MRSAHRHAGAVDSGRALSHGGDDERVSAVSGRVQCFLPDGTYLQQATNVGLALQPFLDIVYGPHPSSRMAFDYLMSGDDTITGSKARDTLDGRGGHPVLLAGPLLRALVALDPTREDARLDRQLAALAARGGVARVPVDDAAVRKNLNTADDWAALTAEDPRPHAERSRTGDP